MSFKWMVLLIIFGQAVNGQSLCRSNEFEFSGHCYFFKNDAGLPFTNAQLFCQQRNSFMVKIDSVQENMWIVRQDSSKYGRWIGMVRRMTADITEGPVTGYHTSGLGNEYEWVVDASTAHWENFNYAKMHGGSQTCIYMDVDGTWADNTCDQPYNVICERIPGLQTIRSLNDTVRNFNNNVQPMLSETHRLMNMLLSRLRTTEGELADNRVLLNEAVSGVSNITNTTVNLLHNEVENSQIVSKEFKKVNEKLDMVNGGLVADADGHVINIDDEIEQIFHYVTVANSSHEDDDMQELKRHLTENSAQLNQLSTILSNFTGMSQLENLSRAYNTVLANLNALVRSNSSSLDALPQALKVVADNANYGNNPRPVTALEIVLIGLIVVQGVFVAVFVIYVYRRKNGTEALYSADEIYSNPQYATLSEDPGRPGNVAPGPSRSNSFFKYKFNVANDETSLVQEADARENRLAHEIH